MKSPSADEACKRPKKRFEKKTLVERHYVLLVHGTWAAPEESGCRWYQPGAQPPNNFSDRLLRRLQQTHLGAAVWRSFPDGTPVEFAWSGENSHAARLQAARELARLLDQISLRDPQSRIHIIAHSHGGNITLKAVDYYLRQQHAYAREAADRVLNALMEASLKEEPLEPALDEALSGPEFDHVRLNIVKDAARPLLCLMETDQGKRWKKSYYEPESDLGSERQWISPLRALIKRFDRLVSREYSESQLLAALLDRGGFNRLGKIALFGTPFVEKHWLRQRSTFRRLWTALRDTLILAPVIFIVLSLIRWAEPVIELLDMDRWRLRWVIWLFETMDIEVPRAVNAIVEFLYSFKDVSMPVMSVSVFFAIFLVLVAILLAQSTESSSNLYIDEISNPLACYRDLGLARGRIQALVVADTEHDEAILGLSGQDAFEAVLRKQVLDLLKPGPRKKILREDAGVVKASVIEMAMVVKRLIRRGITSMPNAVWLMLHSRCGPLISRFIARTAARATFLAALGCDSEDFHGAEPVVTSQLGAHQIFDVKYFKFDASKLENPHASTGASEHLPAEAKRLGRASESREGTELPWVLRGSMKSDTSAEVVQLCQRIEQRLLEIFGTTRLYHSEYYASPAVLDAVADFLSSSNRYHN